MRVQTVNAISNNAAVPSTSYGVDTGPQYLVTADFNRDGIPDLVTVNTGSFSRSNTGTYLSSVSVLLGNGDGTFRASVNYPGCTNPSAAAAADFNLDGKPDLAVACESTMVILLGNGDGSFQAPTTVFQQSSAGGITAVDVNRDGIPDLVTTASGGGATVFIGNGDGTF